LIRKLAKPLTIPALFLAICVFAFGLQIPWLGYYLDDWLILMAYNTGGVGGLMQYTFLGNRPLVFWIWWVGFKLLGEAPLGWQVWTLLWRWLAITAAWLVLRELWPARARLALWAALLFAVYPLFLQQSIALTYSFHWFGFFLYLLSVYWMIRAAREPRRYALYSALALLANTLQLFSMEFFVGLELLRPLILYWAIPGSLSSWKKVKQALLHWGPYALLFAGYLAWRLKFMPTPGSDRNTPELLYQFFTSPLKAVVNLGSLVLKDLSEGLVGVWYRSVQAGAFEVTPLSNWVAWGVGLASALLVFFFLRGMHPAGSEDPEEAPVTWKHPALILGLVAMLAGFAPGWAIGRSYSSSDGLFNDRFGLAAMLGASILVVTLIALLVRGGRMQVLLVCLLVGVGAGQQFRVATQYRWSWEEQTRLFWQMKWRAPGLQPPAALLGSGALVRYIGSWANTSAINLLYAPQQTSTLLDYWYVDLYTADIQPQIEDGSPIRDARNLIRFEAGVDRGVALAYNVVDNQCLWVVDEADRHNPYLPERVKTALPLSHLALIDPQGGSPVRTDIFGPPPASTWCTTYEKATLAEQTGGWQEMMRLWDSAAQAGFRPHTEPEYVPFILAAAHTNRWDLALELTQKAYFPSYVMHDYLCTTWRRIRDEVPASTERQQALEKAVDDFECRSIFTP